MKQYNVYTKLDGHIGKFSGASEFTIDRELSSVSKNAIANDIVTGKFEEVENGISVLSSVANELSTTVNGLRDTVGDLSIEIVESLPISDIKEKTLYLVPSTTSEINNVYDEYIYIDGSWEIIGSTAVDLTNYYKKNEVDTLLGNKVTKEEGKGLFSGSYNDLKDVPTNLATLSDIDKYLKADDNASFYFGVLNHKFGYYTTEARDESDFHEFGSAGFHVPPKDVYNVSIKASDGALTVTWSDPDDTYIEGVDISHWAGTILVMKADTPPADENDGTIVLTNTVRNQYATEGYTIDGLTNNTIYHLYFIPYNQEGDYKYSDNNRFTGMPAKVMLDDVTDISTSGADGSVTVNWTNPSQVKEQDGITATWVKTTVVVKADSQPTSATDGTAYESTVYSENSHTFTLENGKDYYVGFFIESDLGSVTHTTYDTATSLYATVTVSTEETTLIGKTVTATYEGGTLTDTFGAMGFVQFKIPYIGEVSFSSTDGSDEAKGILNIEEFEPYIVDLSFLKIVTFADGTWEEIGAMVDAHYAGKIDITDYWSISDTKSLHLGSMAAVGEVSAQSEQDIELQIIDFNHDDLADGSGKSAVSLSMKNCLSAISMYQSTYNQYTYARYSISNMKKFIDGSFFNALPPGLQTIIKPVIKKSVYPSNTSNTNAVDETTEKCFLFSNAEVFGAPYSSYVTTLDGEQYEFFKTQSNRIKNVASQSGAYHWWTRSGFWNGSYARFVLCHSGGSAGNGSVHGSYGVAVGLNL